MTDALLMMEEREQADEALLRQALEALEGADQLLEDEGYAHAFQQEVIAALKERLK